MKDINSKHWDLKHNEKAIDEAMKQLVERAERIEAELLVKVLTDLHGRKPTIEEYKKVTLIFQDGKPNQYQLLYEGFFVGIVRRHFPKWDWYLTI